MTPFLVEVFMQPDRVYENNTTTDIMLYNPCVLDCLFCSYNSEKITKTTLA